MRKYPERYEAVFAENGSPLASTYDCKKTGCYVVGKVLYNELGQKSGLHYIDGGFRTESEVNKYLKDINAEAKKNPGMRRHSAKSEPWQHSPGKMDTGIRSETRRLSQYGARLADSDYIGRIVV